MLGTSAFLQPFWCFVLGYTLILLGPCISFVGAFGVMLVPELAVPTLREDFPEDSTQCPMGYHFFWSGSGLGGQAHHLRVSGSFAGTDSHSAG